MQEFDGTVSSDLSTCPCLNVCGLLLHFGENWEI